MSDDVHEIYAIAYGSHDRAKATNYIGAVRDANDVWYRFWTCDSSTANFGSNSSCTSLPN